MSFLERITKNLTPTHWMIRLLGLREEFPEPDSPGLVLVQIDGLAERHIHNAMRRGLLPFLRRLDRSRYYNLWPHYSGIPSNTPAVQGELFYGIKQLVPSFHFKDHKTSRVLTMYENISAAQKEEEGLKKTPVPLLEGGSSYGNIFSGGASESHYTAATFDKDEIKRALNPWSVFVVLLFNLHVFIRAIFLMLIELWLAVYDFVRGVSSGYNFMSELSFIPTRIGVSVLLREMIVAGAKRDLVRGLPVIHVNLFGYDEQAHRRGPSSRFAYWSLRGIDSAIRRIADTARRTSKRDYEIWIYSDHGQEDVIPYTKLTGKAVDKAVEEVFCRELPSGQGRRPYGFFREQCLCRQSRGGRSGREKEEPCGAADEGERLIVTAMGPLGHIYPPFRLSGAEIERLAPRLAADAKLPVVVASVNGNLFVWTAEGRFDYEAGMRKVLGEDHPYQKEVIEDLRRLSRHPDAGTFIFLGWRLNEKPVTFPDENGSHGGIGPDETHGFALLPASAPLPNVHRGYLVPLDIRRAALAYLNRREETEEKHAPQPEMQLKTAER